MKRRIAISAGHTNVVGQDRGAAANGYIEGNLTVELRDLIKKELGVFGVAASIDPNESATGDTVRLFRRYFVADDIVVDIHFNAATPQATGTEVIIGNNASPFEKKLAADVANTIATTLSIRNRGVKTEAQTPRKKLLWFTIPSETILIEVCFLSSVDDMIKYQRKKKALAANLAHLFSKYLKEC